MVNVDNLEPSLRLHLQTKIQAFSTDGIDLLPRAKKARALLALLALSPSGSVTRPYAASLLWSSLDRTTALARLRDTLHHLQKGFNQARIAVLAVQGPTIAFRPGVVRVDLDQPQAGDRAARQLAAPFLAELEGIDPAFDRWLMHIREERSKSGTSMAPGDREVGADPYRHARRGPSLIVTEIEASGFTPDQHVLRALTDELASALARLRWLNVITRTGGERGVSPANEDLSRIANYALSGYLQLVAERYRLSLKLRDLQRHGTLVWVANFEQAGPAELRLQEQLANSVAAHLDYDLLLVEAERQRDCHANRQDDAYALMLRAVPAIFRLERAPFLGAGHLLEQAVTIDRDFAMAHSWLALWHIFLVGQGWAARVHQSVTAAGRAAERAMLVDPKDARGFAVAGHVKAFLSRRLNEAMVLHERALQINPALPIAWHFSAMAQAYAGQLDVAHRQIERCRELAPASPHAFSAEGALGIIQLLQGRHEEAATIGRSITERHPNYSSAYKAYLAALGHLGHQAEAAAVLRRLMQLEPAFSLRSFRLTAPYQRAENLEHFLSGLRLAGVT